MSNNADVYRKLSEDFAQAARLREEIHAQLTRDGMKHLADELNITLWDSQAWLYLREHLVTGDGEMLRVMIECAAISVHTPVTDTVLIEGPTGVGKETFARALAGVNPFVGINCTSLPDYLVESELFGHVRGAFTGAVGDREGLFTAAGSGVLFIDEIGDMPVVSQPKLLRALQERTIRRVGSNVEEPIRCRVVCATQHNVLEQVETGRFRRDLYYRLANYHLRIPGLVERPDDIMLWARKYAADVVPFVYDTRLPGNYRELQAIVKRERLRKLVVDAGTPPAK